jgi:HK97 family phage prohead protease
VLRTVTRDIQPLHIRGVITSVDEKARTFDVIFSTGAAVQRYFPGVGVALEELSMDPAHVRMQRLQSGAAPFLANHDSSDVTRQPGRVAEARLQNGEGVARIQMDAEGNDPDADRLFRKIANKIVRNVSVGYRVQKYEQVNRDAPRGETPVFRATSWEPHEVSMVTIPADPGAGLRNTESTQFNPCEFTTREGADVTEEEKKAAELAKREADLKAQADAQAKREADLKQREADAAEHERKHVITAVCKRAGMTDEFVKGLIDGKKSVDEARAAVLDQLATVSDKTAPQPSLRVEAGADKLEKFVDAATNGWLARHGYLASLATVAAASKRDIGDPQAIKINGVRSAFGDFNAQDDGGHYRSLSLAEIARDICEMNGKSTVGKNRRQIVDMAFKIRSGGGEQTISDFAVVLENIMHKVLLGRYAQAPDTWREVCGVDSVDDFRPANRYRLGAFGTLDLKPEGAEYQLKTINDGAKFQITTQTYGNRIHVSREAIINDDMGAIVDQMGQFGRAAGLTLEVAFYALLAQNAGLGPSITFNGSTAAFFDDTAWKNVGTGAALSMASIEADRVKLASQKDLNGNEYLDLVPAVLLVPIGLQATANQINGAKYDPTAGSAFEAPNYSQGLYRKVVGTPRLTGTRRYTFVDPSNLAAFKCVFLNGEQTPMMADRINWDVDGQETKLRLDAKMQPHDPKAALTNAGA